MPIDLLNPLELHSLLDYQLFRSYQICCAYTEATCRAELGVGGRHWRILATVAENAGATLRDIAGEAELDMAQTSRAVGQLVRKGLVRRSSNPSNSRLAHIQLTEQGVDTHRAMLRRLAELNTEVLGALKPAQVRELAAMLELLNARAKSLLEANGSGPHRDTSG